MILKGILRLPQCASNSTLSQAMGILAASKVRFRSSVQGSVDAEEKWDLVSAVCLERHPVITKPMRDIEARYQDMLRQIEAKNGLISNFEIRKQKEKEMKKNVDAAVTGTQLIEDIENAWQEELATFKFGARVSETEDSTVASLARKLDKNLVLLVEQKIGHSDLWIPPQSIRKHDETMVETARRSLQEICGNDVRVHFYGNAPIGFYKYLYPKSIRETGKRGAKVFYFLAKYIGGDISGDAKHCWLDRDELKTTLHPGVHKSLSKFLIPD